jgi:Fic family protein
VRGAHNTTAIEGNTLTEEDVNALYEGSLKLPESKAYLEQEVSNILNAFNSILQLCDSATEPGFLTVQRIREWQAQVLHGLENEQTGRPGQYRQSSVVVGNYRPPEHVYVPQLMQGYVDWLKSEFQYARGQDTAIAVVEAIAAHVYFVLIHPFQEGNGRTGRLIEYYILIRAGLPSICGHIMSNFYNDTRNEYYRQLSTATQQRSLGAFLTYALRGFRDGLRGVMELVQQYQRDIFWIQHIHQWYGDQKQNLRSRRLRDFLLAVPEHATFDAATLDQVNVQLAHLYLQLDLRSRQRDLNELLRAGFLIKTGKHYLVNRGALNEFQPKQRN